MTTAYVTDEQIQAAKFLYLAGWKIKPIARVLQVEYPELFRVMRPTIARAGGLATRYRPRPVDEEAEARKLREIRA